MTLRFDQPALLLLALLLVPLLIAGWRAMRGVDGLRRAAILALRTTLLIGVVIALAQPYTVRTHDRMTVIALVDISDSVQRFAEPPASEDLSRRSILEYLRLWLREATGTRRPDDRFGVIVFDGQAIAVSVPSTTTGIDEPLDVRTVPGTNIADAVRLGLAMFPADAAKRLVLVSDGNQTVGDVVEAAREAAGGSLVGIQATSNRALGIPIDVLPIAYRVSGDVQVTRVEAPSNARPGQTVTLRIVLEATEPTTGRLTLRREGEPVDLNGDEPGRERRLALRAGQSIHLVQVALEETPVNRFEAIFEPDDPARDAVADNNRAESFTATPSKGKLLLVDRGAGEREHPLERILADAGLPVQVDPPELLPEDLLSLQSFDLIILDNIGAFALSRNQHELLARYVNDLGGGLIMIGGDDGFGAGGWNGTALEPVLPLELDPPKELRLPSAALVLVLDKSGSMNQPVAGARATQQEVANEGAALAIESLRSDSLVGVVTFDMRAHEHVPLQRNDDPQRIVARVRGIRAEGGTNLAPALQTAYRMLRDVEVAKKRVVCLSDGRSSTTDLDGLVGLMNAANIQLTTIAVGDQADHETLRHLAEIGGGEYYAVRNPRTLPRVLVDSVQVINKPLLKEVAFVPVVQPTGSSLTIGMGEAPILGGLVVTAPRADAPATIEMSHPDGEPLLARWQAGLGRVAAFTSDVSGPWSRRWVDWPGAATFWVQLARSTARPTTSRDSELVTTIRDDTLMVTLELTGAGGELLDYLDVTGIVYGPGGEGEPVRLRQAAPGRYETTVPAPLPGNYIVALTPRRGGEQLAPAIGGASRSSNPEFRRYQSDVPLLERIAELTGGRLLDLADPASADLFDRSSMQPSTSSLPAWRDALWVILVLVLLDVACRRIAWDGALLRAWLAGALARVTPARVRGQRATATLATLRAASADVERRLDADATGVEKLQTTGVVAPPSAKRPKGADHSRVGLALDTLLGRAPKRETEPETPQRPPPPESADEDRESTETTSGLLAAKRRARERYGEKS